MVKSEKTKKTYYIDSELVKKVKIKSALDETTETEVINIILKDYFKEKGDKYIFD